MEKFLNEFGYILAWQMMGSRLMDDIVEEKYERFFKYYKTGEAFQDIPFGMPEFYKILDKKFPNSKFILTIRNDEIQWYDSILKFHSNLFSKGRNPSEKDVLKDKTLYYGWRLKVLKYLFGEKLYDKEKYIKVYFKHNEEVIEYFKNRKEDLIVVNVSKDSDYLKLSNFLRLKPLRAGFPWKNKTNIIDKKE